MDAKRKLGEKERQKLENPFHVVKGGKYPPVAETLEILAPHLSVPGVPTYQAAIWVRKDREMVELGSVVVSRKEARLLAGYLMKFADTGSIVG